MDGRSRGIYHSRLLLQTMLSLTKHAGGSPVQPQLIRERVQLELHEHIAYVTLSRPEKYNGLDFAMMEALVEAVYARPSPATPRDARRPGAGRVSL